MTNDWQAFRQKAATLALSRPPAATPAINLGVLFGSSGPAPQPATSRHWPSSIVDQAVQLAFF